MFPGDQHYWLVLFVKLVLTNPNVVKVVFLLNDSFECQLAEQFRRHLLSTPKYYHELVAYI